MAMSTAHADQRRRRRPRRIKASPANLLLLLGAFLLAAHAADRPDVLRAGSGLRKGGATAQYLMRKAQCSRTFLGQTPLFKGEWVPHKVSAILLQMHIMAVSKDGHLRKLASPSA